MELERWQFMFFTINGTTSQDLDPLKQRNGKSGSKKETRKRGWTTTITMNTTTINESIDVPYEDIQYRCASCGVCLINTMLMNA